MKPLFEVELLHYTAMCIHVYLLTTSLKTLVTDLEVSWCVHSM